MKESKKNNGNELKHSLFMIVYQLFLIFSFTGVIKAQYILDELDSVFIKNLKSRIILGINNEGDVIQQIERLYNSSSLSKEKCSVFAGTECKIICREKNALKIKCPGNFPGNNHTDSVEAWISDTLPNAFSPFVIIHNLQTNAQEPGINCTITCSDTILKLNEKLTLTLVFFNNLNEPRTIHFFKPKIINKKTAKFVYGTSPFSPKNNTFIINPGTSKTINIKSNEVISIPQGEYYAAILYYIRNEGTYTRNLSNFIYFNKL